MYATKTKGSLCSKSINIFSLEKITQALSGLNVFCKKISNKILTHLAALEVPDVPVPAAAAAAAAVPVFVEAACLPRQAVSRATNVLNRNSK